MATLSKTDAIVAITPTPITHPGSVVGGEIDVSTALFLSVFMYHALVEATANTNPGSFFVQVNPSASGDDGWKDIYEFTPSVLTAATEILLANEAAGVREISVASTGGFVAKDNIYIQDTTTIGNSEHHKVREIDAGVSITLVDTLRVDKDTADVIWGYAESFGVLDLPIGAAKRARVIFVHEGAAGANVEVKATAVTGDSIG